MKGLNSMKRISIYGKGGIGKSTIAVNIALAMAEQGENVLLVGCDPKQDTTRLITDKPLTSILECYPQLVEGSSPMESVVVEARKNLFCCEVGGPKPGVGCAGRGIIIALDLLKKKGYFDRASVVICDVLGDVVCGGFATPVTKKYTDEVYIVTSGEQASLYAANNIIKGMVSIKGNVRGIIFNERNFESENDIVKDFCKEVNVPVIAKINYSEKIKLGEIKRTAIYEYEPCGVESSQYKKLGNIILNNENSVNPQPLDLTNFYELVSKSYYQDT